MTPPVFQGRRLVTAALGACAVGSVTSAIGVALDPRRALASYLVAYAYVASIALGALVFLLVVHGAASTWPLVVRRITEALAATMPAIAVLFVPVALGLGHLYPWAGAVPLDEHAAHLVAHRGVWARAPFFLIRSVVYLALWTVVAELAFRRSVAGDVHGGSGPRRAFGAAALPPVTVTLSFAAFDWLMSLETTMAATMFGVYFFAGSFLSGIAAIGVLAHFAARRHALPWKKPSHDYAIGRLLLAFVVFWGYVAYFQFLITWIADRPEEVPWYVQRTTGGWGVASVVLFAMQGGLPFLVLLPYAPKWRSRFIAAIGCWLLAAHWLDVCWLVLPSTHPGAFRLAWTDAAALLAVGGAVVAFGALRMRGRPLAPVGEPLLELAARYAP